MRIPAITEEVFAALPVAAAVFRADDLRLRWATPSFPVLPRGSAPPPFLVEVIPELTEEQVRALPRGGLLSIRHGDRGCTAWIRRLGRQRMRGVLVHLVEPPSADEILAASPAAHMVFDTATRAVVAANPAAAALFGVGPDALLGRGFGEVQASFAPYGSSIEGPPPPQRAIETGVPVAEEAWRVDTPAGDRTVLMAATPIRAGAEVLAVWLDATGQAQRLERARAEIADREMRVREVNHRVKNTLQIVTGLLGMEIGRTRDRAAIGALRQAYNRLMAAGRVHQRLYLGTDLDRIPLDEYLRDVADDVRQTLAPELPADCLSVMVEPARVEPDLAVSVALIVIELLTNAFKYGRAKGAPARIALRCGVGGDRMVLEVSDAGPGLPADFDPRRTSGLGMQLLIGLCDHLGGSFTAAGADGGATFRVELPFG